MRKTYVIPNRIVGAASNGISCTSKRQLFQKELADLLKKVKKSENPDFTFTAGRQALKNKYGL